MTELSQQLLGLLIILMEFISSFISFLVGYYALKGYRTSSAKGILLLYLGFVILGIGIFLRVVTATYFVIIIRVYESATPHLSGLANLAASIFTLTQLTAYSLFTVTYVLQAKNIGERSAEISAVSAAAIPIFRLFYIPTLELIAITLLGFVTVYSFTNWLLKRGIDAALVFLGFGFMLLSHLFFLLMIVGEEFLFLGQATQLAGFVCLLVMLAKVSKTHG
jgi:hypothetical protein